MKLKAGQLIQATRSDGFQRLGEPRNIGIILVSPDEDIDGMVRIYWMSSDDYLWNGWFMPYELTNDADWNYRVITGDDNEA